MKPITYILFLSISVVSCHLQQPSQDTSQRNLTKPGEKPRKIAGNFSFTEGPAADSSGNVYFTDQPNNKIYVWTTSDSLWEFSDSSGRANGLYFGPDGLLYACSDGNNELWRFDSDGNSEVVLDSNNGQLFNGPNDLWINSEGGIYFTDPYYKRDYWTGSHPENPVKGVYYLPPGSEKPLLVADGFLRPNGIIGSEKNKVLYVSDIDLDSTYRFSILEDHTLGEKEYFTNMASDGMTIDSKGNVYLTGDGVTVFSSSGEKLMHLYIPEKWTGNVCFGGKDMKTLFITASNGLYAIPMLVKGEN